MHERDKWPKIVRIVVISRIAAHILPLLISLDLNSKVYQMWSVFLREHSQVSNI